MSPQLYVQAHAGTKILIEDYISQVCKAVRDLAALRNSPSMANRRGFDSQVKMELFNDTRQALGRSTLVLQGGSALSMFHLGVAKALHKRNLLPKIITGNATGALIAALIGVHNDESLLVVLLGTSINFGAFNRVADRKRSEGEGLFARTKWLFTAWRRFRRFVQTGHLFNIEVLEDCARENLGDITFEEAYAKTGCILNITVALPDQVGIPQLLNYVTAPHVLIWSAVVASIATSKTLYAPVQLYCKDETGAIKHYFAVDSGMGDLPGSQRWRQSVDRGPAAPLKRIGELFNVNHFIISQARPYIVPFIRLQKYRSGRMNILSLLLQSVLGEACHLLKQLDILGLLPTPLCRLIMDETIPNSSRWAKITLTPELCVRDLFQLFDMPTPESVDQWILRGERSVWPAICELIIRCGIEFELDAAYENVKRRVPRENTQRI